MSFVFRHSPFVIFVLALVILSFVTWAVFEAMPHLEDEFAYYFQAQIFASGRLWVPSPPQPESFLVPFAIDLNGRRFSKYPPGFSAVLALGVLMGAHWLINPLIGALTLLALYTLGRDLFDAETGLLAAILGLLSPIFLGLSSTLLAHSLTAFCLLIFTWAYFKISNHQPCAQAGPATQPPHQGGLQTRSEHKPLISSLQSPILGGLALGWAALTRPYTALVYALPFGLLAAWRIARMRRWPVFKAYAVMGLVSAALAALLPLYGRALTGQYMIDLYSLVWPYDRLGFGPGYGRFPGGHTPRVALLNAYVDLYDLSNMLLGWPYLSWLPVLLGLALPPRRRAEWTLLAPSVTIVLAHGAYWIQGSGIYGPRYYYEAVPLLWLLAARGTLKLWRAFRPPGVSTGGVRFPRSAVQGAQPASSPIRTSLCLVVSLALAGLIAFDTLVILPARFEAWRGLYDITREPGHQIAQLDIHNALIFVQIHHWGDYSELAWTNDLTLEGDVVFALDEGPAANQAVIAAYPGRRVFYFDDYVLAELVGSDK